MRLCIQCGTTYEAQDWRCPVCDWVPSMMSGFPALAPAMAEAGGGFKTDYFQQLAELEDDHFWFQARRLLIIDGLQRFFSDIEHYLEIGCGTGHVLHAVAAQFPQAEITGTEIFSAGLAFAQRRAPRAVLLQMDARTIPYRDHFDLVGAFDVLEHIEEDQSVLTEIHKTLHPGGGLVLTVPQHRWLWSPQDEHACHVRRYTARELKTKLQAAGFTIIWTTSFVTLLMLPLWLSRLGSKISRERDVMAELHIGRMANLTFGGVMALERRLIKLGLRFPAGGSLFMVAGKE